MWLQRYSIFLKDKAEIAKISRIVWQFGIFYILLHTVSRTPCLRAGGKLLMAMGQRACPDARNIMGRKAFTTLWFLFIETWKISKSR